MTVCSPKTVRSPLRKPDPRVQFPSSYESARIIAQIATNNFTAATNGLQLQIQNGHRCSTETAIMRNQLRPYTRRSALPGCAPVCVPLWITGCPFTST